MQINKHCQSQKLIKKSSKFAKFPKKDEIFKDNPQTFYKLQYNKSQKSLTRLKSPSQTHSTVSADILKRFKQLQKDYMHTLQITRQRNEKYQAQQKQIQRLRIQTQKDSRQIHRLRGMLGFLKKQDQETQTFYDQKQFTSYRTQVQKSTDIQLMREKQSSRLQTPSKIRKYNEKINNIKRQTPNYKKQQINYAQNDERKSQKSRKSTEKKSPTFSKNSSTNFKKFLQQSCCDFSILQSPKQRQKIKSPYQKYRYATKFSTKFK